jgi:hypothetical protein
LAIIGADSPPAALAAGLFVGGIGFAFLNAPLANEVTRLFPDERRSVALGIYNLALFMGTTTGAAVSTAVVQAEWELPVFAGRAVPGFSSGLALLAALPLVGLIVAVRRSGSHSAAALARELRGARLRIRRRRGESEHGLEDQ